MVQVDLAQSDTTVLMEPPTHWDAPQAPTQLLQDCPSVSAVHKATIVQKTPQVLLAIHALSAITAPLGQVLPLTTHVKRAIITTTPAKEVLLIASHVLQATTATRLVWKIPQVGMSRFLHIILYVICGIYLLFACFVLIIVTLENVMLFSK